MRYVWGANMDSQGISFEKTSNNAVCGIAAVYSDRDTAAHLRIMIEYLTAECGVSEFWISSYLWNSRIAMAIFRYARSCVIKVIVNSELMREQYMPPYDDIVLADCRDHTEFVLKQADYEITDAIRGERWDLRIEKLK